MGLEHIAILRLLLTSHPMRDVHECKINEDFYTFNINDLSLSTEKTYTDFLK